MGNSPYNGYSWQQWAKIMPAYRKLTGQHAPFEGEPCAMCCDPCRPQGEWHSEDYSEPFSFEPPQSYPLCKPCHARLHKRFNAAPGEWELFCLHLEAGGYGSEFVQMRTLPERRELAERIESGQKIELPIIRPRSGDLLVEPDEVFDEDDEEHDEELFSFEFRETPPPQLPGQLWIRVGEILEHRDDTSFEAFKAKKLALLRLDAPKAEREIASRSLDRLHRMAWQDESVCFYTEKLQDYDRVLRIFVRANDAGTKLSKSDLMMSMISSRWSQFSAREEIVNLVQEINLEGLRRNAISRDYVIKAALLLSGLNHQYQVRNLTLSNIDAMQSAWPQVKKSLRATFALLNTYGLDETNLTSLNATLPIAQYIHQTGHDLLVQDTPFNVINAERIRRWIIAALLNTVFGGASDSTITVARRVVEKAKPGSDFPFLELNAELSRHLRRSSAFEDSTIDDVLKLSYGKKLTFLALTLLYDEHRWGNIPHHIDHVFPHAVLSRNALMGLNISQSKIDELQTLENCFANLELLSAPENLEKNAQQFSTWIRTRDAGFLARHSIPEGEHLQTVLMLPKFVTEREKLIRQRLRRLQFDPAPTQAP